LPTPTLAIANAPTSTFTASTAVLVPAANTATTAASAFPFTTPAAAGSDVDDDEPPSAAEEPGQLREQQLPVRPAHPLRPDADHHGVEERIAEGEGAARGAVGSIRVQQL
jgi:hypothetical protein